MASNPGETSDSGEEATSAPLPAGRGRVLPSRRGSRSKKASTQRWARILHVYTSMAALVVVLFFGVTGLTLNHAQWTLFGNGSVREVNGTLPASWKAGDTIDWLAVAEHLRATEGARGAVSDYRADDVAGSIRFNGPGYTANAQIDVAAGTYSLSVEQLGLLAVMNDLHKGRDTAKSWNWLIDVSAVFLVALSLTGLILQLVLRKRRRSSLLTMAVGGLVTIVLGYLTLR